MKTIMELRGEVKAAEDALSEKVEALNAALIAEYPLKPGMVVESKRRGEILITRVTIKYGHPQPYGKKTLKGGGWGNAEIELYEIGWGETPKAIRVESIP